MWGKEDIGEGKVIHCWKVLWRDGGALVSYHRPDQMKQAASVARSLVVDNGAFSFYMSSQKKEVVTDWDAHWLAFYLWLAKWWAEVDWFLVPDVIAGSEEENDALLLKMPGMFLPKAVPVWHSDESIGRFVTLCEKFPRVAIGMCGPYHSPNSKVSRARLAEAFTAIYVDRDLSVKVHGLRMLDGRLLGTFPFDSADSTNVAINVPKEKMKYPHLKGKLTRTAVLKGAIEQVTPPSPEKWRAQQLDTAPGMR